jgi:hypothetical protein
MKGKGGDGDEPDLFSFFGGPGAARTGDPETSWEAAYRDVDGKQSDRRRVLLTHDEAAKLGYPPFGLTDYDLASAMGRQQNSVGKRRGELRDRGLIEAVLLPNSRPMKRPAPSGSASIVWRITERGRYVARKLREAGLAVKKREAELNG